MHTDRDHREPVSGPASQLPEQCDESRLLEVMIVSKRLGYAALAH
jgi:hypothetical protein